MPTPPNSLQERLAAIRATARAEGVTRHLDGLIGQLEDDINAVGLDAWNGMLKLRDADLNPPSELISVTQRLNRGQFPTNKD